MKQIEKLACRLKQSSDVCLQRQGRELECLSAAIAGPWSNRVRLNDIRATDENGLRFAFGLEEIEGLVCEDGDVLPQSSWELDLEWPRSYPHHMPAAWLRGKNGEKVFNPHAIHPDQLISELDMDILGQRAFVAAVRAKETGRMCFLDQWSSCWRTTNILIVIRQVTRCITGSAFRSEQFALNREARDYYSRLRNQARLPLGSPLPLPGPFQDASPAETPEEMDFEFVEEIK